MTDTLPSGPAGQMKLSVFMMGDSNYHSAGWQHADAATDAGYNVKRWIEIARLLEAAKIDMLFVADVAGIPSFANKQALQGQNKAERFEPFTLLAALSSVTTRLGLVATATTTYNEPYTLARTIGSLDLLSSGRAGWNVVTGGSPEDAWQFSLDKYVPSKERYARAEEFTDIVLALWDSVEPDAFPRDKSTGAFTSPAKLHAIDHKGPYFAVKGPLSLGPSPQGRPLLVQAGQSEEGRELASRIADVVFTAAHSLAVAKATYADLKRRAAARGRDPNAMKIMPGVSVTVGRTEQEAADKQGQLDALVNIEVAIEQLRMYLGGIDLSVYDLDEPAPEFIANDARVGSAASFNALSREGQLTLRQLAIRVASSRFHLALQGTPAQVADVLESWFREGAADGFNLLPNYIPGSITDFIDLVLPELRRRGLFRSEYEGTTVRQNLGVPAPLAGWSRAGGLTTP